MNEDSTSKSSPRQRAKVKSFVVLFGLAIFAAWLAVDVARSSRQQKEVTEQVEVLTKRVDELMETDQLVRKARGQVGKDRLFIWDFLRQCRSVKDIPELPTEHVITRHKGNEGFLICVPDGKHRLQLTASWKPAPKSPKDAPSQSRGERGEKMWPIELDGNTCYLLKIDSDRKGGPIRWTLTANRHDFEPRSEQVPIGSFHSNSWSYTGGDLAVYPNQIQRVLKISDLEKAAGDPPPLEIYDVEMGGRIDDRPHSLSIVGRLLSEARASVDYGTAQSIIARRRPDLLSPYGGNGKFELREPDDGP